MVPPSGDSTSLRAKGGTVSRIVPELQRGAGVTTSRAHVQYVATEFGVVNLHGLDLEERAHALIGLAHPRFRDELFAAARELRFVPPEGTGRSASKPTGTAR